jgi:hypothetical protein
LATLAVSPAASHNGTTADKHPKRPRDFSQAAKLVIDIATGQVTEPAAKVDSPAAALGRKIWQ